ncbi:MAG: hypothetical protein R6U44_11475 [Archaeoglobaceae archaeon]
MNGIKSQIVNVEALIDSNLSYEENWKNIKRKVGITKKRGPKTKKGIKQVERESIIQQAMMYHEMRSEQAQALDEKLVAPIPDDPEKWFKAPALYDLRGVDFPPGATPKKKRKRKK